MRSLVCSQGPVIETENAALGSMFRGLEPKAAQESWLRRGQSLK